MFILYVISSSVTGRTQLYYLCEVSLEKKKKKKKKKTLKGEVVKTVHIDSGGGLTVHIDRGCGQTVHIVWGWQTVHVDRRGRQTVNID